MQNTFSDRWKKSFYEILEIPFFYNLSQKIFSPGLHQFLKPVLEEVFVQSKGLILDVGCGPNSHSAASAALARSTIIGVDLNFQYLSVYRKSQNLIPCLARSQKLPFKNESLSEVYSFFLFHHLNEQESVETLREMYRVLKPGGRICVFDNVFPQHLITRPLAYLIRRYDRGEYTRNEQDFLTLFRSAVPVAWKHRRITYTWTLLEGLLLTAEKS